MKHFIYNTLTDIRDNDWVPDWLVEVIDYIRYEWVYPYKDEEYG